MSRVIRWLAAGLAVFATGVTVGGFSAVRTGSELLYDYFSGFSGGEISILTGTAVISALLMWSVLFFSAFFKFGGVTVAATIAMRGFVDGFSVTAILRILGIKGIGMCFLDVLGAPVVLLMSAAVMCALTSQKNSMAAYLAVSGMCLLLILGAAMLSAAMSGALVGTAIKGI